MTNSDEDFATGKHRSEEFGRSWEQTVRNAESILDPDDAPRALFVGLFHGGGTDYSHGVNETTVESLHRDRARIEVLATHITALAEHTQYDRETIANWALEVSREDDDE